MAQGHDRRWLTRGRAELLGKLQEPSHVGAAESVDGLIVVANRDDAAGRADQSLKELDLKWIGVLILVDVHRSIGGVQEVTHMRLACTQDCKAKKFGVVHNVLEQHHLALLHRKLGNC